jgi:hypothetical protein
MFTFFQIVGSKFITEIRLRGSHFFREFQISQVETPARQSSIGIFEIYLILSWEDAGIGHLLKSKQKVLPNHATPNSRFE